jgi:hypothetical protein
VVEDVICIAIVYVFINFKNACNIEAGIPEFTYSADAITAHPPSGSESPWTTEPSIHTNDKRMGELAVMWLGHKR